MRKIDLGRFIVRTKPSGTEKAPTYTAEVFIHGASGLVEKPIMGAIAGTEDLAIMHTIAWVDTAVEVSRSRLRMYHESKR